MLGRGSYFSFFRFHDRCRGGGIAASSGKPPTGPGLWSDEAGSHNDETPDILSCIDIGGKDSL